MSELFSKNGTCRRYSLVCNGAQDDAQLREIKVECERLWELFRPYADSSFVKEFSNDFNGRFWEMYLGVKLLGLYPDLKSFDSGPDFIVPGECYVSVEATVASRGTTADAVPDLAQYPTEDGLIPFDQVVLRITNALRTKSTANGASENSKKGPYVIAINLPYMEAWLCSSPPLSALATLGMGGSTFSFATGIETASERLEISKKSTKAVPVPTTSFWSQKYEHVSAVLLASVSPFFSTYKKPPFEVLHNPRCNRSLPRGWFPCGSEYWVDGRALEVMRHPQEREGKTA